MEDAAHIALERGIDHLVLLHAGFAGKRARDDGGGVMVAIASESNTATRPLVGVARSVSLTPA